MYFLNLIFTLTHLVFGFLFFVYIYIYIYICIYIYSITQSHSQDNVVIIMLKCPYIVRTCILRGKKGI